MPSLVITGTDTGVGKTTITCAIARAAIQQGRKVIVSKPIATGATRRGDRLLSEDTIRLAEAVGDDPLTSGITKWVFEEPVAPSVAARRALVPLDLDVIRTRIRSRRKVDALLLVEGVGGLMCPLTDRSTFVDLLAVLGFPVLVVARRSLGTLNHTLLTLEVAHKRGLDVRGMIINEADPPSGLADETNVEELRRHTKIPILAVYPHGEDLENDLLETIDWWALAE